MSLICLLCFAGGISSTLRAQDDPLPTEFFDGVEPKALNMEEAFSAIIPPHHGGEGMVVVRILVDTSGDYVQHIVVKDPDPVLTKVVTQAIPALKFSPAIINGKPTKAWVAIPFSFRGIHDNSRPVAVSYRITALDIKLMPTGKPSSLPIMVSQDANLRIWEADGKLSGPNQEGGTAQCTFTVDEDGRVASVVVWSQAQTLDYSSRTHLTSCIKLTQWEPAKTGKKQNKPTACQVQLTFTLEPQ